MMLQQFLSSLFISSVSIDGVVAFDKNSLHPKSSKSSKRSKLYKLSLLECYQTLQLWSSHSSVNHVPEHIQKSTENLQNTIEKTTVNHISHLSYEELEYLKSLDALEQRRKILVILGQINPPCILTKLQNPVYDTPTHHDIFFGWFVDDYFKATDRRNGPRYLIHCSVYEKTRTMKICAFWTSPIWYNDPQPLKPVFSAVYKEAFERKLFLDLELLKDCENGRYWLEYGYNTYNITKL